MLRALFAQQSLEKASESAPPVVQDQHCIPSEENRLSPSSSPSQHDSTGLGQTFSAAPTVARPLLEDCEISPATAPMAPLVSTSTSETSKQNTLRFYGECQVLSELMELNVDFDLWPATPAEEPTEDVAATSKGPQTSQSRTSSTVAAVGLGIEM